MVRVVPRRRLVVVVVVSRARRRESGEGRKTRRRAGGCVGAPVRDDAPRAPNAPTGVAGRVVADGVIPRSYRAIAEPQSRSLFFLFASTILRISAAVGGFGPSGGYTTYACRLIIDSRFTGFAAKVTVRKMGTET
mmetsp:Transcript_13576/g.54902  ORF Transcript_13576/g.54902 Transcript_13576/m.54902 type:complete len:135 (-) Transcript_13576:89-493(-)